MDQIKQRTAGLWTVLRTWWHYRPEKRYMRAGR
jgi:hypothetical protein